MDQNDSAGDQLRPEGPEPGKGRFVKIGIQAHKGQRRQVGRKGVREISLTENGLLRMGEAPAYLFHAGISEITGRSSGAGGEVPLCIHVIQGKAGKGVKAINAILFRYGTRHLGRYE